MFPKELQKNINIQTLRILLLIVMFITSDCSGEFVLRMFVMKYKAVSEGIYGLEGQFSRGRLGFRNAVEDHMPGEEWVTEMIKKADLLVLECRVHITFVALLL